MPPCRSPSRSESVPPSPLKGPARKLPGVPSPKGMNGIVIEQTIDANSYTGDADTYMVLVAHAKLKKETAMR